MPPCAILASFPDPSTLTDMLPLDYGDLEGGLVRMMERHRTDGTLTGDAEADNFLRTSPEAVLLGLLFDQRVRAESAFTGPQRLHARLGHLDLRRLAAHDPDDLRLHFAAAPAVHRFTNTMAETTQKLAGAVCEVYDARAAALWDDGADAETVAHRVRALPGFGPDKAKKIRYVLHYFGHRDFSGG